MIEHNHYFDSFKIEELYNNDLEPPCTCKHKGKARQLKTLINYEGSDEKYFLCEESDDCCCPCGGVDELVKHGNSDGPVECLNELGDLCELVCLCTWDGTAPVSFGLAGGQEWNGMLAYNRGNLDWEDEFFAWGLGELIQNFQFAEHDASSWMVENASDYRGDF